jgi:hypothetical protein
MTIRTLARCCLGIWIAGCAAPIEHEVAEDLGLPHGCSTFKQTDNFFQNFFNDCYAIRLGQSSTGGGSTEAGDANAIYHQLGYLVGTGREIVLYAPGFQNARYSSIQINDSHGTLSPNMELVDEHVVPLNTSDTNPYLPGAHYGPAPVPWAVRITFGDPPFTPVPGCGGGSSTTLDSPQGNALSAQYVHQNVPPILSWTADPAAVKLVGYSHADNAVNRGGMIFVRDYSPITTLPVYAIVRDTSTGCAIKASDAQAWVSPSATLGSDVKQMNGHFVYADSYLKPVCYAADAGDTVPTFRGSSWVPGPNIDAAYAGPAFSAGLIQSAITNDQLIEVRFQMPTHPATPCADGSCTRTGNEDLRERVVSFMSNSTTLGSLDDSQFITSTSGDVDLLINVNPARSPFTLPASTGYTTFDAASKGITGNAVRDVLPNPSFACSYAAVPYQAQEVGQIGRYGLVTNLFPYARISHARRSPRTDTCGMAPAPIPCP